MDTTEIQAIAERVRKMWEEGTVPWDRQRELYLQWANKYYRQFLTKLSVSVGLLPEKDEAEWSLTGTEVDKLMETAKRLFPTGCCGLASCLVAAEIPDAKVVTGAYVHDGEERPHTWVEYESMVVDVTADQFGGPRVYVGEKTSEWVTLTELFKA